MDLSVTLKAEVTYLADKIGERNYMRPKALEETASHLELSLKRMGYSVDSQTYQDRGHTFRNLSVERKGTHSPERIWIIGAHYDSVIGSPGANDNGSGVAALLALASRFAKSSPAQTLRFVFFVNEEPPFFQTHSMGSWHYAKACRKRRERIEGMISLETLGYYSEKEGSQNYPGTLAKLYPNQGNFIALVGNLESKSFLERVAEAFRHSTKLPLETAAFPPSLPGIGWSDHWAFWQEGYSALMLTDTAPFRYPHYHLSTDTPDRIDYSKIGSVVEGIAGVMKLLAQVIE